MKKITFRRQVVLVVWMLLCGLSAQAADEDLITEQITINALEAGTLPTMSRVFQALGIATATLDLGIAGKIALW